jgi:hypothetical protein
MTVEALKDCNKKVLARMAKDQGITGWHAMRKDQLIRALGPVDPSSRNGGSDTTTAKRAAVTASPPRRPVVPVKERTMATLPSRPRTLGHDHVKDRIITMVRDPYWLHTYWELSRATLGRAQAALGQDWHAAKPILRLMDVTAEDTTTASERHIRDIPIHGGVNNWYIDVTDPPRSYRVDVGYLSQRGKFFVLARSNVVAMPRAGVSEPLDQNWASVQQDAHRIYHQSGGSYDGPTDPLRELLEERLGRPMQTLSLQSLMTGALAMPGRGFHFEIDAELIVYGTTEPNARVCLGGEPVPLRDDGTFTVRFSLPDARQIIPATAASPDGVEERTIVLAVERNTKELEPMIHDGNEL